MNGRRVAGAIRSLIDGRSFQFECARALYVVAVLPYGSVTMIWREKERSKIWAVQIDNLRGLLNIRIMDKVPNAWIRQLISIGEGCGRID